jgi:hypothetical protein
MNLDDLLKARKIDSWQHAKINKVKNCSHGFCRGILSMERVLRKSEYMIGIDLQCVTKHNTTFSFGKESGYLCLHQGMCGGDHIGR